MLLFIHFTSLESLSQLIRSTEDVFLWGKTTTFWFSRRKRLI